MWNGWAPKTRVMCVEGAVNDGGRADRLMRISSGKGKGD